MSQSNSRKDSTAAASWGEKIEKGRTYELTDGKVGLVKFIGKTFFKPGVEWFGLELTKGKGKNNGTVMGTSYFDCEKGKGVFVQINKFKKQVSSKQGKSGPKVAKKAGALATGKNKDYNAAEFKQADDGGGFLGEKNVKASEGGEVAKKDGAIATGKNEDYDAAKFKVDTPNDNDGKDFLASKENAVDTSEKAAKKEGPRDVAKDDAPAAAEPAAEPEAAAEPAAAEPEAAAEPAAAEPEAAAEPAAAEPAAAEPAAADA